MGNGVSYTGKYVSYREMLAASVKKTRDRTEMSKRGELKVLINE